ncbi:mechanosensitive ion channel family protein [Acidihalobacter ferrooxydans]|uniref:mechanosensitive ion channel family protein n=1 Tax=Acidihalobacter ferrooxydans TaxID=1765967 RepID=UPI0018DBDED8|nr:mechanosensitive ion channel domain-containing protein [Acidihalobacter ferrooxydans]
MQTDYVHQLTLSTEAAIPGIFAGFIVFLIFLAGAVVFRRLLRRLINRMNPAKRPLVNLAGDTVYYGLVTVGGITGLGTMGVNVSALIAGLGLSGFALGFALRDAVSNLIAGILILLYQPFQYGDTLTVAGDTGVVTDINFRYTVLAGQNGTHIHVPNGTMFSNSVTVTPKP